MNKKDIKYYLAIAVILILTIVFEILKPQPIDWRFSLENKEKAPYGTYVLFNTINEIFPKKKITQNKKTIYEFNPDTKEKAKNYIFISQNFNADKLDTKTILNLANNGNTIFVSSQRFSNSFSDTLGFSVDNAAIFDTSSNLNFYNIKLKKHKPYFFSKTAPNYFFNDFDTLEAEVLAFSKEKRPVFIKQKYGKGFLFINTCPEVFTNYAMVTEKNYDFAYKTLSYLPVSDVVWDEYYKPFRRQKKSNLSLIFENKSFKAAYLLLIAITLIFVMFTVKRRQRIIPIVKPFENKTIEFVETIGRVYFHSKNHKDIALKKYQYLRSFLLSQYNINLSETEEINFANIAEKCGTDIETTKKVLQAYFKINKLEKISAEQLNTFNNNIEDFYDECK